MSRELFLRDIIALEPDIVVSGDRSFQIRAVCADSRKVQPGDLFFAISGDKFDGAQFIEDAIRLGAVAIVVDVANTSLASSKVTLLRSKNIRKLYALAVASQLGRPSDLLRAIGVTGTNGKSSTAWILAQALAHLEDRSALLGTLGCRLFDRLQGEVKNLDWGQTTGDALLLHQFLAEAGEFGAKSFVCEVTSHALVQHRSDGIHWAAAAFTNLTRDHLDYHGTFEEYGAAKRRLFTELLAESPAPNRLGVINIDDPFGAELAAVVRGIAGIQLITCSQVNSKQADISLVRRTLDDRRSELVVSVFGREVVITSGLVGSYQTENSLVAIGVLAGLGCEAERLAEVFPRIPPVPGRLERIPGKHFSIFVDYAHTPDALEKAQASLRPLTKGRLLTVFGCGGDRDRGKRPKMAAAVEAGSDIAIVTSDNPRSEDPNEIIAEVVTGFQGGRSGFAWVAEADRRRAIEIAISQAKAGDVILVAGKGHEPYQEIRGVKYPFSDTEICNQIINATVA